MHVMMTGLENQQKRKVSQLFTFEVEKQRRENICLHLRIHILKKLESVFREVSTTAKCTKPVVIYPSENKWISGKLGKRGVSQKSKRGENVQCVCGPEHTDHFGLDCFLASILKISGLLILYPQLFHTPSIH